MSAVNASIEIGQSDQVIHNFFYKYFFQKSIVIRYFVFEDFVEGFSRVKVFFSYLNF